MTAGSREPPAGRSALAALAVAAGILLSRLAGLVRQRVFGGYLGTSPAADAFTAALRIPNVLQNLLGEGVLSASFIPAYARRLAEGDAVGAARLASAVACLLLLAVATWAALGIAWAPAIVALVAPGFGPEEQALTVSLVRIAFPGIGLLVLSAWCLGVLNSHRRFFLSYAAPVVWNAGIVAVMVAFGALAVTPAGQVDLAVWTAWGTVLGAALQLLVLLPSAVRAAGPLRPALALADPEVRGVVRGVVPVVASRGVVQLSAFVDQALATLLGGGANAAMAYAQTVYLLPVSLFGMSVSAAELPEMSAAGAKQDARAWLRDRLAGSLGWVAFLVVPTSVAFLLLGDVVVAALFQTGRFSSSDTRFVWAILAAQSLGLLATTWSRLLASALYALRNTRAPLRCAAWRVGVGSAAGAAAAAAALSGHLPRDWGAPGLAGAAGLGAWVELVVLRRALGREIGGVPFDGVQLLRLGAAALGAAAIAAALRGALPALHPVGQAGLVLGTFGGAFAAVCLLLRDPQARAALAAVHRRVRRGGGRA